MFSVEVQVVQAYLGLVLALFEEVDGLVDSDAIDPGVKAGTAFEGLEGPKCFYEGLLGQVIGIFVIRGHVVNGRVNALLVTPNQLVVSRQVATTRPFDQVLLGRRLNRSRRQ